MREDLQVLLDQAQDFLRHSALTNDERTLHREWITKIENILSDQATVSCYCRNCDSLVQVGNHCASCGEQN